jgi:hypothetical protein
MKNLCLIYVSMVKSRRRQLISMVIDGDDLGTCGWIMENGVSCPAGDRLGLPVRVRAYAGQGLILE